MNNLNAQTPPMVVVNGCVTEVNEATLSQLQWLYFDLYTLFVYEGINAEYQHLTDAFWDEIEADITISDGIRDGMACTIVPSVVIQAREDARPVYDNGYPVPEAETLPSDDVTWQELLMMTLPDHYVDANLQADVHQASALRI